MKPVLSGHAGDQKFWPFNTGGLLIEEPLLSDQGLKTGHMKGFLAKRTFSTLRSIKHIWHNVTNILLVVILCLFCVGNDYAE